MTMVTLDGITVQHAGELLYETSSTTERRHLSAQTYRKCLEDVAFVLVCADQVAVNGNLPDVGASGERPGQQLVDALGTIAKRIAFVGPSRDELVATNQVFRRDLGADISHLDLAFDAGPQFWIDFAIREAQINLGTDPSLAQPNLAPLQYRFTDNYRYVVDGDLSSRVPQRFVARLTGAIRELKIRPDATDAALGEFMRRVAVTHVANEWHFRRTIPRNLDKSAPRLPHVTRSLIRNATTNMPGWYGRIQRMILPNVLAASVPPGTRRDQVLPNLLDLRARPEYRRLRDRLNHADVELRAGNSSAFDALVKDIEAASTKLRQFELGLGMKAEFELEGPSFGVLKPKVKVPIEFLLKDTYWLTAIGTREDTSVYRGRLIAVFPELSAG